MSNETLALVCYALAITGLAAYAVLGGADFGGGLWDLFATGPRKEDQRKAIAHAMGPVWEANHVWLIFAVVVVFISFPTGYVALMSAIFVPLHLVIAGIILRGCAFVFRGYGPGADAERATGMAALSSTRLWGPVFGVTSIVSPLLLGAAFGSLTAGGIAVAKNGDVTLNYANLAGIPIAPWFQPYPLLTGLLSVATCAYIAAVYLAYESEGQVREDFRTRAIIAGTATAALALVTLIATRFTAPWFFGQMTSLLVAPILLVGAVFFAASAYAVFTRRYNLSRLTAAGQIVVMLMGWFAAHHEYLIYPDIRIADHLAPRQMLLFVIAALPIGSLLLVPSLIILFKVFKPAKKSPVA